MTKILKISPFILSLGIAACSGAEGDLYIDSPNIAPIATAGSDQFVNERAVVQLEGVAVDPDSQVQVNWMQVSGPAIELENTSAITTSFVAPSSSSEMKIVLRLIVDDGVNERVTDDVVITVSDTGNGPNGVSPQGIPDGGRDRREAVLSDRERSATPTRPGGDRDPSDPTVPDGSLDKERRSYDGTYNNTENPNWGASFSMLQRIGPADYSDLIDDMAGLSRPSARVISNELAAQSEGVSIPNTHSGTDFVWQWGQFIDHDIGITDGTEEAANIAVPEGDEWFDPDGTQNANISFNRALYNPNTGYSTDNPRQQFNEITAWIDGSMIYGSSDERNHALRAEGDSPLLLVSSGNLLPFNSEGLTNANGPARDPSGLFLAGDVRANEQVGLTVMHTLFVREHNRLANEIKLANPRLSGNEIYDKTRRMVTAKVQKITFEEWLPVLLGEDAIPPYLGYDANLNPSIYNEFSVAAFRLGHSMLNEKLLRLDASGNEIQGGHLSLAGAFFVAPQILDGEDSLEPILRGLASQHHQSVDTKVVNAVRNFLFGAPGDGGLDLAALNVQRGRDHGVPNYNTMRQMMGLQPINRFSDITSDEELAGKLEEMYGSVNDIDLWVGGLSEDAHGSSQLGELFHAMVVKQFAELRNGDRFWYQNDLTLDELAQLNDVNLAKIIRDNTSIGDEIQENVFLAPSSN